MLQGKTLDSKLLSTMSALALFRRHYFSQALGEAHKVLGGTGPAVAQLPLTVIWAGGTVFDLTRDLAARRVGALSVLPRVGFITLTGIAQFIGVASKLEAALLAMLPYERSGTFSDSKMVARYIVRPQNAVEAFGMARRALVLVRPLPTACLLQGSNLQLCTATPRRRGSEHLRRAAVCPVDVKGLRFCWARAGLCGGDRGPRERPRRWLEGARPHRRLVRPPQGGAGLPCATHVGNGRADEQGHAGLRARVPRAPGHSGPHHAARVRAGHHAPHARRAAGALLGGGCGSSSGASARAGSRGRS